MTKNNRNRTERRRRITGYLWLMLPIANSMRSLYLNNWNAFSTMQNMRWYNWPLLIFPPVISVLFLIGSKQAYRMSVILMLLAGYLQLAYADNLRPVIMTVAFTLWYMTDGRSWLNGRSILTLR